MSQPYTFALIVAGGAGLRFAGPLPKQYIDIDGQFVLTRTLKTFINHPAIDKILVVIKPGDEAHYATAINGLDQAKLLPPAYGGVERQDSVRLGLEALRTNAPSTVLIHDAVRPFVSTELISAVIRSMLKAQAAIPVLPVTDTIKQVTDWHQNPQSLSTLPRANLASVQTPQGFAFNLIDQLHQQYSGQSFTDDAALCEANGVLISLVPGEKTNIKITTQQDIADITMSRIHSGQGFDVHRFTDEPILDAQIWLCGIAVPHTHQVIAHSDGDVALHALADALLGAAGLDDIGAHFPPSDPQWKDCASAHFITHIMGLLAAKNARIQNVDVTIIAELPKVGPVREKMRARLAELLQIPSEHVNIKATTTEKLGFLGRSEGIAAQAIATILFN